jgi:hypothetical protein
LVLLPVFAEANCQAKSATQVIGVLVQGIDLNDRFKRSANSNDESAYKALRKQNEHYSEETALPCVRRAVELLDYELDDALLRKLMEYAVSRQNSADETLSEAVAMVFARHPNSVAAVVANFAPARAKILLRSVQSGWPMVRKDRGAAVRQELEGQLKAMRDELAKRSTITR